MELFSIFHIVDRDLCSSTVHSDLIIAFPWQQCCHRATILRYEYIAYLVVYSIMSMDTSESIYLNVVSYLSHVTLNVVLCLSHVPLNLFDVGVSVHHIWKWRKVPTWCNNFITIINNYMFRASICPSSGVYRLLNTICSSIQPVYSWSWAYRCPKHVELFKIINKIVASSWYLSSLKLCRTSFV